MKICVPGMRVVLILCEPGLYFLRDYFAASAAFAAVAAITKWLEVTLDWDRDDEMLGGVSNFVCGAVKAVPHEGAIFRHLDFDGIGALELFVYDNPTEAQINSLHLYHMAASHMVWRRAHVRGTPQGWPSSTTRLVQVIAAHAVPMPGGTARPTEYDPCAARPTEYDPCEDKRELAHKNSRLWGDLGVPLRDRVVDMEVVKAAVVDTLPRTTFDGGLVGHGHWKVIIEACHSDATGGILAIEVGAGRVGTLPRCDYYPVFVGEVMASGLLGLVAENRMSGNRLMALLPADASNADCINAQEFVRGALEQLGLIRPRYWGGTIDTGWARAVAQATSWHFFGADAPPRCALTRASAAVMAAHTTRIEEGHPTVTEDQLTVLTGVASFRLNVFDAAVEGDGLLVTDGRTRALMVDGSTTFKLFEQGRTCWSLLSPLAAEDAFRFDLCVTHADDDHISTPFTLLHQCFLARAHEGTGAPRLADVARALRTVFAITPWASNATDMTTLVHRARHDIAACLHSVVAQGVAGAGGDTEEEFPHARLRTAFRDADRDEDDDVEGDAPWAERGVSTAAMSDDVTASVVSPTRAELEYLFDVTDNLRADLGGTSKAAAANNAHGVCLRVDCDRGDDVPVSVLILGDATVTRKPVDGVKSRLKRVLDRLPKARIDAIQLPHHGSKKNLDKAGAHTLVRLGKPGAVYFVSGRTKSNRAHPPHAETFQRVFNALKAAGKRGYVVLAYNINDARATSASNDMLPALLEALADPPALGDAALDDAKLLAVKENEHAFLVSPPSGTRFTNMDFQADRTTLRFVTMEGVAADGFDEHILSRHLSRAEDALDHWAE